MKYVVVFLIALYQRYFAPYKRFRCAYKVLHGGDSCSEAVKKIVLQNGCFQGRHAITARFKACKQASQTLGRQKQAKDCLEESCDCLDCDLPSCDFSVCDSGCDLPCDCSF